MSCVFPTGKSDSASTASWMLRSGKKVRDRHMNLTPRSNYYAGKGQSTRRNCLNKAGMRSVQPKCLSHLRPLPLHPPLCPRRGLTSTWLCLCPDRSGVPTRCLHIVTTSSAGRGIPCSTASIIAGNAVSTHNLALVVSLCLYCLQDLLFVINVHRAPRSYSTPPCSTLYIRRETSPSTTSTLLCTSHVSVTTATTRYMAARACPAPQSLSMTARRAHRRLHRHPFCPFHHIPPRRRVRLSRCT